MLEVFFLDDGHSLVLPENWLVHGPWYTDFRYVYFVKEVVVG